MAESKSKILIIGVTGNLGFELAKASLNSSHRTLGLGSLQDEESLVKYLKQVDVVICAVSAKQALDQKLLIPAIRRAGCIKRFFPSEFGLDPDKTRVSHLDHNFYSRKSEIRRLVESEGIPYTYICCNFYTSYLLPSLVQPGLQAPPRDKVSIFGDGNVKGVFVKESDVAAFTISTVDDPRTLNKVLYLRPPGNTLSMNELVDIWEKKIGKSLERNYISEEELLKKIHETPYPDNMQMVFIYSVFVKGDQTYFDIESSNGVDGTQLYPHIKYTKITEFFQMAEKSKILIIGGTGYIGKFIVQASTRAGHPTFILVRESTLSNPAPHKSDLIQSFRNSGVKFILGDLYDHESLVKAIKQVDVVISTVGYAQLNDQGKIVAAIKEAGNVKRFFPSEFGNDVDRVHAVEPAKTTFAHKAQFRRLLDTTAPPRDKVVILGDGNVKAVYNREEDIATYTIKAVDDPRTLNKILYIRPPANAISMNDLVSLWEKKIGKNLEKIYVPEEQVVKNIQEASAPLNVRLAICHSAFVKGDQTNFEIEPSFGVEASELYPDVKYITVDEVLDQYV
ncbi:Phenylcoumaran benzylic ether reductase POP1 [Sesamum alatum]|uniref:Phenylcoumaran benzylic ether reductase POP1 n=1 Tax=Sesamum alatum TaxID=300844 RepID=A0AAE1YWV3_9LAMI|nr:Phenylcoumaran benzylic ether reductase POP1 [Sesamum alatum]